MTLLQINLIVEAASKNSVSAAAQELGIAQSNASQTIKKLEEELGFPIFRRTYNGIALTEEGYLFLKEAEKILRADKAIHSISSKENSTRLRVGVINYTPATAAFIRFCNEKKDIDSGDFVCVNVGVEEGILRLKERSLDVVVSVLTDEALFSVRKACNEYRLRSILVCQIPICVRLRKDHPLVQSGTLDGSRESFMQLKDYPFVEYSNLDKVLNNTRNSQDYPFGYSYIISVDERQTRLQTVAATNGYSIGCPTLQSYSETYGLAEIPVKGETLNLIYIIRNGDEDIPSIIRYAQFLKDEVDSSELY